MTALRERFAGARGYHNACTLGLPPRESVEALRADLDRWSAGESTAAGYGVIAESARSSFAGLVGVPVDRVAIGSQTSVMASVLAGSRAVPSERGRYASFYDGVARTLLEGAPPPVDVREALAVVAVIEQAHRLAAR